MAKASILMIAFGVVLLVHGLFSGFWFLGLIERSQWAVPWLLVAMFLGSFPETGVGALLIWWALRRPS